AYAGAYEHPAYGRIEFTMVGDRLEASMGLLWSPVEVYDGDKNALRVEFAGAGRVVVFRFGDGGKAESLEHNKIIFKRVK
ncbi:MAG: hypothetical protein ACE5MH_06360, partial [Terriglobia bacterium]